MYHSIYGILVFLDSHLMGVFISLASICATIILFEILTGTTNTKKSSMLLFSTGSFVLVLANIQTLVYEGQPGGLAHAMMYIANFTSYAMNHVLLFAFNLYLEQFFTETNGLDSSLKRFKINNAIIAASAVFLVIAQFTGLYYTIDKDNVFQIGKIIGVSFLGPMLVLVILISLCVQFYRKLPKNIRLLLLLFSINPILSSTTELILSLHTDFLELESSHQLSTLSTIAMSILLYVFDLINIRAVEKDNSELQQKVDKQNRHIIETQDKFILSLAVLVESRDKSTGEHISRTKDLVKFLIEEIEKETGEQLFNAKFKEKVIQAAPLHDIGKISVKDEILCKPGKFTTDEYAEMKTHAQKGADALNNILKDSEEDIFKDVAVNMANYHHERWDGSGYPNGLKGDEIPFEARIMAIADVYDALVSKRVYKNKMSFEEADKIITEGMGTQFDPLLEQYYIAARPLFEEYYKQFED